MVFRTTSTRLPQFFIFLFFFFPLPDFPRTSFYKMAQATASPFPDPAAYYPIVGIQDGLDPDTTHPLRKVGIRMELDSWYDAPDLVYENQRALFFPAFKRFTEMKPTEKFSFFQIAGIHGYPEDVPWDEPGMVKGEDSYCPHGRIIFTTWHRAYLLLFEQVIYTLMKERAHEFPESDRAELLEAAESWRLPYWDVALKRNDPSKPGEAANFNVPKVFRLTEVNIRLPVPVMAGLPGAPAQPGYPNALYQFTMPLDERGHKISMGHDSLGDLKIIDVKTRDKDKKPVTVPFSQCFTTSRRPTAQTFEAWAEGEQNNDGVAQVLQNYKWKDESGSLTESLREAFYKLFTIEKFEDFGTAKPPAERRKDMAFDSAEGLHNSLHNWLGGEVVRVGDQGKAVVGHMHEVPVAAFDPIFWFHHNNIDRLWAIWQVLWDGTANDWFDPGREPGDDSPEDDLRPFHRDAAGSYWNSNRVRETTALGYTYPWLEKWQHTRPDGTYDKEAHKAEVIKQLTKAYNSPRSAAERSKLTRDPGEADGFGLMSIPKLMAATHRDSLLDLTVNDYVVNVIYEKLGLAGGQPFTVHIFIGQVPTDPLPYDFHRDGATLVGEVFNFTARPTDCANCRSQAEQRTLCTGRVTLTNALITRWKNQIRHEPTGDVLASMEPADVVKFLAGNLHWRVTSAGQLVEPLDERIPSLKVSLAVGKADHFADVTKLSRFYDYKGAFEPTLGRPGGAGPEDGLYPEGEEFHT
ncbi:common central domain of tyrosinase-domain-containing protein [Apodospora peruviana]|uniref:tyrosinase n=1 Tax=Apodospora peruviana TaxID=516989 RepID=A0AAE0HXT4_9PEZI|nr:common central domain of tyrosinase-domain-containing protein [Apodospora peruviana]